MTLSKNSRGAFSPLTPTDARVKVAAFREWRTQLPTDQKSMLHNWESTLMKSVKDMGDISACELIAEILLQEKRIRDNE